MNSIELRAARANTVQDATTLMGQVENDTPTDEQQTRFDALMASADQMQAQIDRLETLEAARSGLEQAAAPVAPTPQPGQRDSGQTPEMATPQTPRISAPRMDLRAFANSVQGEQDAHTSGKWLQAVAGNLDARQWCRDNGVAYRVMQEGSNPGGGYLVPDVLQNSIINLQDQWGTARQQCQMVQMTSDTMAIPKRSSGPTAYWVGEGSTITASDAAFTRVHLTAKKLATITRITSELLEDSVVALADWIAQDAALALTEAEDSAWILGDGTSTYGGIYGIGGQFDANESLNGVYTAASGVDTFSEITPTDLAGVIGLLPQRAFSGRGARWLCSNLAKAHAFERLGQIGGGTNVITIGEGLQQTYSGYPIVINEKCPRAETAYNSSMIYFGNFDLGCVFGDRRQTTIQLLTELYAASDEVAVKVTERIAINFHEAGDDTNAGVVVALWGE